MGFFECFEDFTLVLVLFILLVIVGAAVVN